MAGDAGKEKAEDDRCGRPGRVLAGMKRDPVPGLIAGKATRNILHGVPRRYLRSWEAWRRGGGEGFSDSLKVRVVQTR